MTEGTEIKRTLYWDKSESRWVTVLYKPMKAAYHVKHPKTVIEPEDAKKASDAVTWPTL